MASAGASPWHAERLAAGLAMIAGYIDAYGLIRYQTYLSFMSGNTTQTGSQWRRASRTEAPRPT